MFYLFILKRLDDPGYDENLGFVVSAKSNRQARVWASANSADEGKNVWLDVKRSSCKQLKANQWLSTHLTSFNAG